MGRLLYPAGKQRLQQGVIIALVALETDIVMVYAVSPVLGQDHRHPFQPGQGQDGHMVRRFPFGVSLLEVLGGAYVHDVYLDLHRLGLGSGHHRAGGELQLVNELVELQLEQLFIQNRPVEGLPDRLRRVKTHGRVAADDSQVIAHPGVRLPLGELFDDGGLGLDVRQLFINGVHRLVLLDQRHGGFLPYALDAGVVVGGIPHQRFQVDHVDGVEAVFGPELVRGHVPGGGLAHAGGHQLDGGVFVDELQ